MHNERRTNISAQVVVGHVAQGAGEQNRAGDSLLLVDNYIFLIDVVDGIFLVDYRADKMRTVLFDALNHVVEKFGAVGNFPIVIALVNGHDECLGTFDKLAEFYVARLHWATSPKNFYSF